MHEPSQMTKRYDLVTIGETMLRLSPPGKLRFGQTQTLDITFGGAESNVASTLAQLGWRISWWSRLPDNFLGRQLTRTLNQYGIDTEQVLFVPDERLGTYYIEYGAQPRPTQVLYDRTHSAASRLTADDLPTEWLQSGRWLHLTGITPALSESCYDATESAVQLAKASGMTISFDVNYRSKLWTAQVAAERLEPFCKAADVVFVARRDAQQLFHVSAETCVDVSTILQTRWGGSVVVSDGSDGVAGCDGENALAITAPVVEIVDRIGAGDALASGVIDRFLSNASLDEALRYGVALASLKLTIAGDIALVTRQELREAVDHTAQSLRR